jgi:histidine ammonia-lyase
VTLVIRGSGLTVEDVVRVARHGEKVELHPDSIKKINSCRSMLEKKVEAHEIMYGVNTGIGELSEIVLNDDQVREFQRYLIYNHAAGMGDPMSFDWVRGAMLSRINVHAHGNSGCRLAITQTLVDMLNKGVTPYVCKNGSVGACGDLAPMAQIALLLMGEGHAYHNGEFLEGRVAMERVGIPIPGLEARDGLAAINGSNVLTAMSALMIYDTNNWLKQAEIACAMSLEALKANFKPYHELILEVR